MKITIIGGGNMGGAIARGLSQAGLEVTVTAAHRETLDGLKAACPALNTGLNNREAVRGADVVMIAVKPWLVERVLDEIGQGLDPDRQLVVSVAGGVSFEQLAGWLDKKDGKSRPPALFRAIPNTAIALGESMTVMASCGATEEQRERVKGLFDRLGKCLVVEERLMDAGSSLCSCGTAFALRYVRAAMEAGVEMGFYPAQAREIVARTVKGAMDLLLQGETHPEAEVDRVTTPGGTTIRGLNAMEEAGFTSAVIKGHKATLNKR